jgi:hypothetical protein
LKAELFLNLLEMWYFFASWKLSCRQYDIDLRKEREVALLRLQKLCRAGFISVLDFKQNPLRIFAAHEIAAMCGDGSLGTKMTVQVCAEPFFLAYELRDGAVTTSGS